MCDDESFFYGFEGDSKFLFCSGRNKKKCRFGYLFFSRHMSLFLHRNERKNLKWVSKFCKEKEKKSYRKRCFQTSLQIFIDKLQRARKFFNVNKKMIKKKKC